MTRPTRAGDGQSAATVGSLRRRANWLDERLDLRALHRKYGRKVFPVHSTFFLGEMALFAFVILVLTGIYLGFIYVPSNAEVTVDGETMPEAYASVRLIESIPVANLFRNTHHWAAHLMIASILLHTLRIFFTGTYRKPREINWGLGVALLGLSLMAGFVGYALPYDAYAVTATGIGFSIARSIPWIGEFASELFFGGAFPTLGSLARLYTLHVFVIPAIIAGLMGLHLLLVVKQKHSQPGYARRLSEPGKVLGVPLVPYQALLAGQLLLLMFGALFLLSAFVAPHPLEEFGPPRPETPEVKPDWYLLWIYGFLKIVPPEASFKLFGETIGPDFLGGLLFPALIFGVLTLAPWMDRTNRRTLLRFEYMEPVTQSPIRTALGLAILTFLGTLYLAAYYDEIGLSLGQIWLIVLLLPVAVAIISGLLSMLAAPPDRAWFDPREQPIPMLAVSTALPVGTAPAVSAPASPDVLPAPADQVVAIRPAAIETPDVAASWTDVQQPLYPSRAERARDNIVTVLHELGELAPMVRQTDDGDDLLELLRYVDSLRLALADSNDTLQGVIRAEEAYLEQ